MSGYSIGAMIGPLLVVALSDWGGLRSVFIGFSALFLQCVWLGGLLRPLNPKTKQKSDRATMIESIDLVNGAMNVETSKGEKIRVQDTERNRASLRLSVVKKPAENGGHDGKDWYEIEQHDPDNPTNNESNNNVATTPETSCGQTFIKATGLKPCGSPVYLLWLLGTFCLHAGHIIPYVLLPLRMVSLGTSEEAAALYITILAATGLVFRIIVGAIIKAN